jgi:hypothetical protein
MGVSFYICHYCKYTFPDCGPYERCESCGRHWCSDEYDDCAKKEGLRKSEESDNYGIYESTCSFCRDEKVEEHELLKFLLYVTELTLEEAEKQYFQWKNKQI